MLLGEHNPTGLRVIQKVVVVNSQLDDNGFMMKTKGTKMTTITEYAHLYLQGYETIPVGILAKPEFQAEVRRLWGPVTPRSAGALKHVAKQIKAVEKHLASLRGPRGGLPKTGLSQYKSYVRQLEALKRELQ